MKWTFSLPVWGDWHVKTYLERVLPFHKKMGLKGKYIIHTDRAPDILPHVTDMGCEVEFRSLRGSPDDYYTFARCHAEVFQESEACVFLCADAAFSWRAFDVIKNAVEERKRKLIAMCSLRTVSQLGDEPPLDPKGMNSWAVKHIHHHLRSCIWGHNPPSLKPTNIFFEDGENFWARGFHLHPIAAVNDGRKFNLDGTVDGTLVTAYWPHETWVVQNHEIAGVEFTHESRLGGDLCYSVDNPKYVADSMRDGAKGIHRHFFTHKIALRGEVGTKYDDEAREVYAHL